MTNGSIDEKYSIIKAGRRRKMTPDEIKAAKLKEARIETSSAKKETKEDLYARYKKAGRRLKSMKEG